MGKLIAALLLVFAIEVALVTFGGVGGDNTSLFTFLMDMSSWQTTGFWLLIVALFSISAYATIVPGSFVQVNQWALYGIACAILITFFASIAHLWSFMGSQLGSIMDPGKICSISNFCISWWIASLICAPLGIFYIISISEWFRSNQ